MKSENLVSILSETARSAPDRPALLFANDRNWSGEPDALRYADLHRTARAVAVRLRTIGAPGGRVLLLYPTGIDFLIAFLGCVFAGMVPVPAPAPGVIAAGLTRITAMVHDAEVCAVLTGARHKSDVVAWLAAETVGTIPVLATDTEPLGDPERWLPPLIGPDTLAFLQYTSGSTTDPRGVMVTHGNLMDNFRAIRNQWRLSSDTRMGSWIPNYHDMGLIGYLLFPVFLGITSVIMSPTEFVKRPHRWLECIDRWDITHSTAPNFAYDLCVRRVTDEQVAGLDLRRWRFACNGSEPVDNRTLARFRDRFVAAGLRPDALCAAYGLAEATLFVCASPFGSGPTVIDADPVRLGHNELVPSSAHSSDATALVGCGAPAHLDALIVDSETRQPLPDGRVGEIWLRGPGIAQGYWRNPAATARTFDQATADGEAGFLRTGDLGVRYDGELFITGRVKEVLVVNGRNLYPQDLEREIREIGEVFTHGRNSVFAVPVPREEVVVIQEVAGRGLTDQRLGALASDIRRGLLSGLGVPVANVVLVRRGVVRTTTSGKVRRALMRELFMNDALGPLYEELGEQTADCYR